MRITQYCTRCGCRLELDFGRRKKKGKCSSCKLNFKYKEAKDGTLCYDYRVKDLEDLYIGDEKFLDVVKQCTRSEVKANGAV